MELVLRWIANQQGSSRGNISQKVEAGSICALRENEEGKKQNRADGVTGGQNN